MDTYRLPHSAGGSSRCRCLSTAFTRSTSCELFPDHTCSSSYVSHAILIASSRKRVLFSSTHAASAVLSMLKYIFGKLLIWVRKPSMTTLTFYWAIKHSPIEAVTSCRVRGGSALAAPAGVGGELGERGARPVQSPVQCRRARQTPRHAPAAH